MNKKLALAALLIAFLGFNFNTFAQESTLSTEAVINQDVSPDTAKIRLYVENTGSNSVKIHVNAENIANSNIIFDTPASSPVVVTDSISRNTLLWSILAFIALSAIFFMSKNIKDDPHEDVAEAIQKSMRDREIEIYKNYRKELLTIPSIDYKIKNPRVKEAIRRADTIRHLQRVVNK